MKMQNLIENMQNKGNKLTYSLRIYAKQIEFMQKL